VPPDSHADESGVAVVIATLGRADALELCLNSLAAQTHRPAEVTVVHSGSDAATRELCERNWVARGLKVDYQRYEHSSAALQRDFGARQTRQPLLMFADDDVEFDADFVERLHEVLSRDAAIGAVMGRVGNHTMGQPTAAWRAYRRVVAGARATQPGAVIGALIPNGFPPDAIEPIPAEWLGGSTSLIKRAAYFSVNGFAPHYRGSSPGEDIDLGYRISRKWKILYVPAARCLHHQSPSGRERISRYQFLSVRSRYGFLRASAGMSTARAWIQILVWAVFQSVSELSQLRRGSLPTGFLATWSGRIRGAWSCIGWDPTAERFPEWHDTRVA
jgi:GT2 family glycosyltransferase